MIAKVHSDFYTTQDLLYDKLKLNCSAIMPETESSTYGACSFKLNNLNIRFRVANFQKVERGENAVFEYILLGIKI